MGAIGSTRRATDVTGTTRHRVVWALPGGLAGWSNSAWCATDPSAAPWGPWLFGSVALVLVAGLAYLAGARSRSPKGLHPSQLLDSLLRAQPAGLLVLRRQSDGAWIPLSALDPTGLREEAGRPGATEIQKAAALAAGAEQTIGGWTFRREEVEGIHYLVVWPQGSTSEVPQPTRDDSASFSYTVSHDLRAPLRAVDGFTRILKEDYGRQLDRIGNDHLDRVLAAAARMNAMIDAMLSLARLSSQPLARQPVNLSQLAGYIAEDLRRSTPTRHVQVDIEPDLQATGDPTLLRQVLENLLANAWKYTGRCEKAQIALSCKTIDGRRVFEVSDNGAGFDMRSAERLFGLFQRLHSANEFPGTGVGLASVKRIVHRHGGEIWAESTPGEGARFFFTLAG